MSVKVTAKLSGIAQLQLRFGVLEKNVKNEVFKEIAKITLEMEAKAKEHAPVDMGQLRATIITKYYKSQLAAFVACTADYAPFIEFGTGPLGQQTNDQPLPSGYAHSGSRKRPPLDLIFAWVQRKGFTMAGAKNVEQGQKQLAYLIAKHIGERGSKATPFMYTAYLEVRPKYMQRIADATKRGQAKSKG